MGGIASLAVAEVVEDGDVGPSLVKPDVAVVEVIPDLNRVMEGLNPSLKKLRI